MTAWGFQKNCRIPALAGGDSVERHQGSPGPASPQQRRRTPGRPRAEAVRSSSVGAKVEDAGKTCVPKSTGATDACSALGKVRSAQPRGQLLARS